MKNKKTFLTVSVLLLVGSCNNYKRTSITGSDFFGRNKVLKSIDRYDVFVHQADSVYEVEDISITPENQIKGTLEAVPEDKRVEYINLPNDEDQKGNAKNDIHIYLDSSSSTENLNDGTEISIDEKAVKNVQVGSKYFNGILGVILTILLIFLLLIAALIAWTIFLVVSASTESTGDSGSGDSGSDSGSGCYVATMAYGSYEAPKVIVLRKFRDQVLQHSSWGRNFIRWYYANSPGFVERHRSKEWLHTCLRGLLNTLVFCVKPFLK